MFGYNAIRWCHVCSTYHLPKPSSPLTDPAMCDAWDAFVRCWYRIGSSIRMGVAIGGAS